MSLDLDELQYQLKMITRDIMYEKQASEKAFQDEEEFISALYIITMYPDLIAKYKDKIKVLATE